MCATFSSAGKNKEASIGGEIVCTRLGMYHYGLRKVADRIQR